MGAHLKPILVPLLAIGVAVNAAGSRLSIASDCAEVFAVRSVPIAVAQPTDRLISYLNQLLENNAIGEREIVTLREGANPIPHKATGYGPVFESAARQIQYDVVQRHMQSGALDHARIKAWVDQKLQKKAEVRESREEARVETQDVYRKMEFHRLPPGKFVMRVDDKKVQINLPHAIEMMSTPITQKMWVDEMGENLSNFREGPESIEVEIKGNKVWMQPDHPVETVTWWSVVVFANRLSEKAGLKPVYDLSEIKFRKGGKAENGTLRAIGGHLKINAPDGDIYQAEGFRLPTEAEQEYVLRNLGRAKRKYPHDLTEAELAYYAWFDSNSNDTTHAVGTTTRSLSIEGRVFDDLIGNVFEWSHDDLHDPTSFADWNSDRGLRGGSFMDDGRVLLSSSRASYHANFRSIDLGARLVRTVR